MYWNRLIAVGKDGDELPDDRDDGRWALAGLQLRQPSPKDVELFRAVRPIEEGG